MPQFRRDNTLSRRRTFPSAIPFSCRLSKRETQLHRETQMLSKLKSLLVAGAVLPLAAGFAFAQNVQPATSPVANPPAAAATAPALAPSAAAGKSAKDLGALKATPAEKKAQHDKVTAAAPATKTADSRTAKQHVVKKHEPVQKTGARSSDAVPAKKL
jgi:hypothetical protein